MEDILQNEELMKKLAAVETVDGLNKVFAENNIVLEDGVTAEQFLEAMKGSANEELGEDDLMDVSGGALFGPKIRGKAREVGIAIAKYLKKYRRPWLKL